MAAVVDIINLALSHIGDRATVSSIDPPEGSAQADHAAQFWPIARDEALAEYDWRFASTTTSLARIDDSLQNDPRFVYAYALPADFLVARAMVHETGNLFWLEPNDPDFDTGTIEDGTRVFFTNYTDQALRYTRRVTDPSRYSPKFVTALSYLMAAYLAGPVVKGRTGAQTAAAMRQAWTRLAAEAAAVDANQHHGREQRTPAGLQARRYGAGSRVVERGQYRYSLPFWAK